MSRAISNRRITSGWHEPGCQSSSMEWVWTLSPYFAWTSARTSSKLSSMAKWTWMSANWVTISLLMWRAFLHLRPLFPTSCRRSSHTIWVYVFCGRRIHLYIALLSTAAVGAAMSIALVDFIKLFLDQSLGQEFGASVSPFWDIAFFVFLSVLLRSLFWDLGLFVCP